MMKIFFTIGAIFLVGTVLFGFQKINAKQLKQKEKSLLMKTEPKYSKPDDAVLKKKLTAMQYKVTQKDGTEPSFNNEYHDNKADGIYVDIVSGVLTNFEV